MKINSIEQLDNGVQKKRYADHIYKWRIDAGGNGEVSRDEMLAFCQTYLKHAERTKSEYFDAIRDPNTGFNEHMKVICGHYYTLESNKYGTVWTYTVVEEYID
jgi:hypothetical protein|nr:MAG TPA: hypothetical protein [Caudoviricetes sp.]